MNRRPLIVFLIVLCLAATWWWDAATPTGQKSAPIPARRPPTNTGMDTPAMSPPVSSPSFPAPNSTVARAAAQTEAPIPAPSPSTPVELTNALSGMIGLIQSHDFGAILDNNIEPEALAQMRTLGHGLEDSIRTLQPSPRTDIWLQVLQAMKDQTPEINDAGDVAIYKITDPTGRGIELRPVTFHKVNGQWYLTVTEILKGAAGYGLTNNPPIGL